MRITFTLIINLMIISALVSVTWEIKQDGTGDFTTISTGISVAQDGDTLLVYPGIYSERINYQGKNITITGLYDGDQYDSSYIANTVIDGNHEGTVVLFVNNETRNAVLNGFTIRNGYGEAHGSGPILVGGGICIRFASPTISNCIIEHNYAYSGGGIYVWRGTPLLKGNTIRYNHAIEFGGIRASGIDTDLEFSTESLNSVYLNYGSVSCDLTFAGSEQSSVVIDTFTVSTPDKYFFTYVVDNIPDFSFTINHGIIDPVASDLYVSPDGSDDNSGLTPDDPLQTIALAMIKIAPDSLIRRTVHLAEGIYSPSLNNQLFPVSPRGNIDLIGAGKNLTVFDGEDLHPLIIARSNEVLNAGPISDFAIKNLSMINGNNPIRPPTFTIFCLGYVKNYFLENLEVTNCHTFFSEIFLSTVYGNDYEIRNLHIYGNTGGRAFVSHHGWNEVCFYGENIRVRGQVPGPLTPDYTGGWGIGMVMSSHWGVSTMENSTLTLVNLEVTDNLIDHVPPYWSHLPRGNLEIRNPGSYRIINATIGNNHSTNTTGGGFTIGDGITHIELINSIVYGNTPHNIAVQNYYINQGQAYISHSLIQGGEAGILYFGNPNTIVHWGEGNIDRNPRWMGDDLPDYPYMLSENSPARNAGTLDIADFEFPEYDLAGNPRIYGDSIDMGAYEWNPLSIEPSEELISDLSVHDYRLHNYPNPIVNMRGMGRGKGVGTNISFVMPKAGNVVIDIYNLKGQFVRRVINAYMIEGEYDAFWNGRDEQERIVATGFYLYQMQINGKTVASGRCTFVK